MKPTLSRSLADGACIVTGSAAVAMAYNRFLIPHQTVPGGAGGVAMVLNHFFETPGGLAILVINVPPFILGFRVLGRTYGAKSLLGVGFPRFSSTASPTSCMSSRQPTTL